LKESIILYLISGETAPNFVIRNAFEAHFVPCYDFDWVHIASQIGLEEMHRRFIETLKTLRPHYCFMQVQDPSKMDPHVVREMAKYTKIIHWTGDVRSSAAWYNWMADIGREVYLTLFTNETDVEKMRAQGVRANYLQVGFDDVYYRRRTCIKGWPDIVFVATDYDMFELSSYRKHVVLTMYEAFPHQFRVFGNGWHKWGIRTESISHALEAECYNSCKIALSISNYQHRRYHSDRLLRIMGCGCFALSHAYPGLEKDYTPGFDIEKFSRIDELIERCNYYLINENERKKIGSNALETAHTKCTWNIRCIELKQLLAQFESPTAKMTVAAEQ